MRTGMVPLATAFVVAISAAGMASSDRARAADVIIGAGAEAAAHFHVGRAICRAISKSIEGETCRTERIDMNSSHNGTCLPQPEAARISGSRTVRVYQPMRLIEVP